MYVAYIHIVLGSQNRFTNSNTFARTHKHIITYLASRTTILISLFTNCTRKNTCQRNVVAVEVMFRKALAAYSPLAGPTEMEKPHRARFCGLENCVRRQPGCNRPGRHGSATIVWPIPEMFHNHPRWASTANSLATTLGLSCPNPTVVLQRCSYIDCCLWPTRRGCYSCNVLTRNFI